MEQSSSSPKAANGEKPSFTGAGKTETFQTAKGVFEYTLQADWITLHKKEKPAAKMFYFAYLKKEEKSRRPICFVFNGGPGASSVYLHLGALGPQRIAFTADGKALPPPHQLVKNEESWLPFADLVFVDPIGTGFSRVLDDRGDAKDGAKDKKEADKPDAKVDENEYFQQNRDLESISEFMEKFLTKEKRWNSPVYLVGESYGGYRVAKLARMAQEKYGIALSGVFAVSPAFEFNLLNFSDTNVLPWLDILPSLAASAIHHGKSQIPKGENFDQALEPVEKFVLGSFLQHLVLGAAYPEKEQVYEQLSRMLGLPVEYVKNKHGRIQLMDFARGLLKEKNQVLGVYDASTTGFDPYPDRDNHQAPDPSLAGIEGMFRAGIQSVIADTLGSYLDQTYNVLSMEVNTKWKSDEKKHYFDLNVGATDDLRYALSLNPNLKIVILHGYFDLVTPYFSSKRLMQQIHFADDLKKQIVLKNFPGGHMFYSWEESRKDFTALAKGLIANLNL